MIIVVNVQIYFFFVEKDKKPRFICMKICAIFVNMIFLLLWFYAKNKDIINHAFMAVFHANYRELPANCPQIINKDTKT